MDIKDGMEKKDVLCAHELMSSTQAVYLLMKARAGGIYLSQRAVFFTEEMRQ